MITPEKYAELAKTITDDTQMAALFEAAQADARAEVRQADLGGVFPRYEQVDHIGQSKGGLTKRELFAASALQGLLSRDIIRHHDCNDHHNHAVMNPLENYEQQSRRAFEYADAMLKAGEK